MGFLPLWMFGSWLGVRIWIWIYLLFSVSAFLFMFLWVFKQRIKLKYYTLRFPEKIIRVMIHYPSNYYKQYYRLIPEKDKFEVEEMTYKFSTKSLQKINNLWAKEESKGTMIQIEDKKGIIKYRWDQQKALKYRWSPYPTIHYLFNCPEPLNFNFDKKRLEFSADQLKEFKENDLFTKLLTLDDQTRLIFFILVMVIINIIATGLLVAIEMGWIKTS